MCTWKVIFCCKAVWSYVNMYEQNNYHGLEELSKFGGFFLILIHLFIKNHTPCPGRILLTQQVT